MTQYVQDVYEETCVCDTPLCNSNDRTLDFFCHGGDFKIKDIIEIPEKLNQTYSCYTNRNQCYIMKYSGPFGERARFGCAPLNFENQPNETWIITNYIALSDVEVYSCYQSLCNSIDILKQDLEMEDF